MRIVHGSRVTINSKFVSSKASLGTGVYISVGTIVDERVFMGRYSYIGMFGQIVNATIGSFCSIGHRVTIASYEYPYTKISTSSKLYNDVLYKSEYRVDAYNEIPAKATIGNDGSELK